MADKQINQLTTDASPVAGDFIESQKAAGGAGSSRKVDMKKVLGGNTVQILAIMPPATLAPTIDLRVSATVPNEQLKIFDFDDTTIEYLDLLCRLGSSYGGGGLTFDLTWFAASAVAGDVEWEAAIRRLADDAENFDSAHTYVFQAVTSTAPGTSGNPKYAQITFTDGAQMDSLAAGERFILRMRRNPPADDMVGDASLWAGLMTGSET